MHIILQASKGKFLLNMHSQPTKILQDSINQGMKVECMKVECMAEEECMAIEDK